MKAARSHVENVAHVLTELKHLLPMVLLTLRYKCRAEFEKRRRIMSGRTKEETAGITHLGSQGTKYDFNYCPEVLETFINKHPDHDYFVKFNCPEFTSLCPMTGQPDFGNVIISYVPSERMVESKSLKLYLFSFRNHGDFHEDCINIIMKDLISLHDLTPVAPLGRAKTYLNCVYGFSDGSSCPEAILIGSTVTPSFVSNVKSNSDKNSPANSIHGITVRVRGTPLIETGFTFDNGSIVGISIRSSHVIMCFSGVNMGLRIYVR